MNTSLKRNGKNCQNTNFWIPNFWQRCQSTVDLKYIVEKYMLHFAILFRILNFWQRYALFFHIIQNFAYMLQFFHIISNLEYMLHVSILFQIWNICFIFPYYSKFGIYKNPRAVKLLSRKGFCILKILILART